MTRLENTLTETQLLELLRKLEMDQEKAPLCQMCKRSIKIIKKRLMEMRNKF
jgi:hypothetical protein